MLASSSLFRVVLIPAGVFVSVMFAGGSATGLEIATFMTSHGPVGGVIAIALIGLTFSIAIFLCYEIARLFNSYDYLSFSKVILGRRLYVLYEIAITLSMFGVIAYSTTGGGTALADHFELPRLVVTGAILAAAIFLTYQGRRLVELTMVFTTVLLLGTVLWLVLSTIQLFYTEIAAQFANTRTEAMPILHDVWIYSVVVMAFIPVLLYAARDLKSRTETIVASVASAIGFVLPLLGMHVAFLSHYPLVLEQDIPNAWIADNVLPGFFSGFFVIVLNIVILQTAVGMLQGIIERLETWNRSAGRQNLSNKAHALIAAVVLVACLGLSTYGVQKILGWLYDVSFWLYLAIMLLPLVTVGSYRIVRSH